MDASGKLIYTQINEPQSKYMYRQEIVSYPHFVWSFQSTIRLVKTNELIGVSRRFGTHGGVVMKFLRRITGAEFEGSADYCGVNYSDVIKATIPPIQSKKY